MTRKTTKPKEQEGRASLDSDYTIYPTSDGYKSTLPWIIKDYEEKGAFSSEQKQGLSEKFNMDPKLTDLLSVYVGNCLDIETSVGFYSLTKSTAIKRGRAKARVALRHLKAERSDDKVRPMLDDISGIFSDSPEGKDAASLIADETADLKSTLETLMKTPGAIASKLPDDKRAGRDSRRILIVEHCCYVWVDSGRKITYTTLQDSRTGDRRVGHFFDLVNSVVEMVTHPSQKIRGETLRADVDWLIKKHGWNLAEGERPNFMTEEPEFGKGE